MNYRTLFRTFTFFSALVLPVIGLALFVPAPAHAQTSIYNVLTQADLSSPCNPALGDISTNYNYGCCGSPGRRECGADLHYTKWLSTGCTDPGSNVYQADTQECDLGSPNILTDPVAPGIPPGGRDFTFYVTSDSHPWRDTFNPQGQVNQVTAINGFAAQRLLWNSADKVGGSCPSSSCTGLPATPISAPEAIWYAGDMTTHAGQPDFGSFRLMWEQGQIGGGINYPVYVGMGNHDLYSDVPEQAAAMRMWNYMRDRMGPQNMDTSSTGTLNVDDGNGSHDYSRDWQGVHIVQANTAPGDDAQSTSESGLTQNSVAWLKNDLAAATLHDPHKPIIIIQHIPNDGEPFDVEEYDALAPYNVIAIIVGHTHRVASLPVADLLKLNNTVFDEFEDGAGGWCQELSGTGVSACDVSGSVGEFIPVRITDNYLDIAMVGWTATSGTPTPPTFINADPSNPTNTTLMLGGIAGCRKRINTIYNDITAEFSGVGSTFGNTMTVTSPILIHGPVAAKLTFTNGTESAGNAQHDFADACAFGAGGHYYVILNGGNDIPANTPITINPFKGTSNNLQWTVNILRMVPMQSGSTPTSLSYTDQSGNLASQPPNNNALIGSQSVVLNGPANDILSFSVAYLKTPDNSNPSGWLGTLQNSNCVPLAPVELDVSGYATYTMCFIATSSFLNLHAGVANAVVTVTGTSGQTYAIPVTLTLRAAIQVSLSSIPGSNPPQFTATMKYNPLPSNPDGSATLPIGEIQLQQVSLSGTGVFSSPVVLSTQIVNDYGSDCPPVAQDEVIFGNSGNASSPYCGSSGPGTEVPGTSVFTFPTTDGVYYLQASYIGEGPSPSPGPWSFPSTSPVVPFILGSQLEASIASGNLQSATVGTAFTTPMSISMSSSRGDWAPIEVMVTFTLPASGASGTFADGTTQAIVAGGSSARIPTITANSITGKWLLTATVVGGVPPLQFELENLPASQAPVMSASLTAKQGTLSNRVWTFNIANTGPTSVTAPQIDSMVIAPILPKSSSTGVICNSPVITTHMPFQLPAAFDDTGGTQSAAIKMQFGACDPKALYNVTVTLSDGAGHTSGSYLKAVNP